MPWHAGKAVTAPLEPLRADEIDESLVNIAIIGANEHLAVCGPDVRCTQVAVRR